MINSAPKGVSHQIMSNNELFHYNPVWVIKRLICQCRLWQVPAARKEGAVFTTVRVPQCSDNSLLSHQISFILYGERKRDAVILLQKTHH